MIHDGKLLAILKILSWSCHDLGKDSMTMQDRAKGNYD